MLIKLSLYDDRIVYVQTQNITTIFSSTNRFYKGMTEVGLVNGNSILVKDTVDKIIAMIEE